MTYTLQHDAEGAPVLVTGRLVLRKPAERDWDRMRAFWSSERSRMIGGPLEDETCRRALDGLYDQWNHHGFSQFTVTRRASDDGIGGIGPFYPETHPEPELGWSLWSAEDEGQGLAFEAAAAARDWFFDTCGFDTAVSHTDPENHRSHRLCQRLGAVIDPEAARPADEEGPLVTWRHRARAQA